MSNNTRLWTDRVKPNSVFHRGISLFKGLPHKSDLLYHNLLDCDPSRKLTVCATYGRLPDDYGVSRMSSIKMSTRPNEIRLDTMLQILLCIPCRFWYRKGTRRRQQWSVKEMRWRGVFSVERNLVNKEGVHSIFPSSVLRMSRLTDCCFSHSRIPIFVLNPGIILSPRATSTS